MTKSILENPNLFIITDVICAVNKLTLDQVRDAIARQERQNLIWLDKDGKHWRIHEMKTSHLLYSIAKIERDNWKMEFFNPMIIELMSRTLDAFSVIKRRGICVGGLYAGVRYDFPDRRHLELIERSGLPIAYSDSTTIEPTLSVKKMIYHKENWFVEGQDCYVWVAEGNIACNTIPLIMEQKDFRELQVGVDYARGSGRTTRQMVNAPRCAIFVWLNEELGYPRRLAQHLGRNDLRIVSTGFIERGGHYGYRYEAFVVDHAFDWDNPRLGSFRERRNYYEVREPLTTTVDIASLSGRWFEDNVNWVATNP